jgi:hypothetical protein
MNSRLRTMTAAVALMFYAPIASYPQVIPPAPPGTIAPSAVDTKSDNYTQQQLDQMLAPIALYPDQLVFQILMASTFPLQIVQAARWLNNPRNAALKGDALVNALQPMTWDPSVKSIVAFPAIVRMLNQNLDWTNSLGVAFSRQQSDVMAQIQFLRRQAQEAGNLASNDRIVCRDDGTNIVITPANPKVVYAPYYNPRVVYGTWRWAEYPPVYFPPTYFGVGPLAVGVGWGWGPAWPIVPSFWGWYGVNWGMRSIAVDSGGYSRIAYGNTAWSGGDWQHPGGPINHGGFGGGGHGAAMGAAIGGAAIGGAAAGAAVRAHGSHQGPTRGANVNRQGGGGKHQGGGGYHQGGGGGYQGAAKHQGGGGKHQGGGHQGGGHQGGKHGGGGGDHGGGGKHQGGGHQGGGHQGGGGGGKGGKG